MHIFENPNPKVIASESPWGKTQTLRKHIPYPRPPNPKVIASESPLGMTQTLDEGSSTPERQTLRAWWVDPLW